MRWLLVLTIAVAFSLPIDAEDASPNVDRTSSEHDRIMAEMDALVFPKIEFKDATLEEAIRVLTRECKTVDPNHRGVRFVIHFSPQYPTFGITLDDKMRRSKRSSIRSSSRAVIRT
jgi:hypothetical protein